VEQEWLSLSEAAERLGVSVHTMRRWARDGKLRAEQHKGAHGTEYRVRSDELPTEPSAPLPSADAVELAATIESLRAEVRAVTRDQHAREATLRAELEKTGTELGAALEALRQTRETVADLHRQLEDRDKQLEGKTRALVAARRQAAVRESGRLNALRENLQEGQRPWWKRLKGKEKE
jgi:excisionase family DNA binding protein